MRIDQGMKKTREYTKDLLLQIETKYKKHKDYEENLEWDINPAKEDVTNTYHLRRFGCTNTYHLRRIGYHLCTIFNDDDLAEEMFELAVVLAAYDENGDLKDDKDDLIDVLNDMTFLDEAIAKSVAGNFDLLDPMGKIPEG